MLTVSARVPCTGLRPIDTSTTQPLQQNGNRAPGIAAASHYFISKLFCLRLSVCLAETTVSWWCSQNSCNYLEMAPKRRVRTPSRAVPTYSATLPSQPPTVASPGVTALDISSTIAASITAAMQPVVDRMVRLEASPAISSTDDAAVSVPVQAPAHGKSSISWSSISRTIVDKVLAGQYVEMASLLPLSPTSVTAQEHTFRLSTGTSGNVLVSQQPRSGRKITVLADWLEAWNNSAEIVRHSHPDRKPELALYQHTIFQAACMFDFVAVAEYDRLFRSRAALDSSMRWDSEKSDLYTTTFNAKTCRLFRQAEGSRRNTTDTTANDICRLFNWGTCKRKACAYTPMPCLRW